MLKCDLCRYEWEEGERRLSRSSEEVGAVVDRRDPWLIDLPFAKSDHECSTQRDGPKRGNSVECHHAISVEWSDPVRVKTRHDK
ncbi:hypothetical protein AVEN_24733-1 [Araneus ventricosus]|uniref:Uncharacterized protein n=1 Tax=Araneus ventricosus TaxID=182803 RepID=A0A4Y2U5N5_ARAVE|nr:hypothetical protein AVEN_24733-1 [Araneus ventricosus]